MPRQPIRSRPALETPVDPPPPRPPPGLTWTQVRQVKRLPGNGAGVPHLPGLACSDRIQHFQASCECPMVPRPPPPPFSPTGYAGEPPPHPQPGPTVPAHLCKHFRTSEVTALRNAGIDSRSPPKAPPPPPLGASAPAPACVPGCPPVCQAAPAEGL